MPDRGAPAFEDASWRSSPRPWAPGRPSYYYWPVRIEGLLIDLDGTLYTNDGPIEGARAKLPAAGLTSITARYTGKVQLSEASP